MESVSGPSSPSRPDHAPQGSDRAHSGSPLRTKHTPLGSDHAPLLGSDHAPLLGSNHAPLLDRAILRPSRDGLSTLHLLLGSLSPTFDLRTMALYVKNFQLTTAKQLLRLFRVRYPSAYKAEIVRCRGGGPGKTNSEGSSSEGSGSDREGGEGEELTPGDQQDPLFPGRVRHSYRRIRESYSLWWNFQIRELGTGHFY